jgi:hypothetical protein
MQTVSVGPPMVNQHPLFFALDGTVVTTILRPDSPNMRDGGSAPKYETPVGVGPRCYFPPAPLVDPTRWADLKTTSKKGQRRSPVTAGRSQSRYFAVGATGSGAGLRFPRP